jgi:hypothetical protein
MPSWDECQIIDERLVDDGIERDLRLFNIESCNLYLGHPRDDDDDDAD